MTTSPSDDPLKILVTGASGYIGGRLVPQLIEAGHQVRVLVRDPGRLRDAPWASVVEIIGGNLLDPKSLGAAFEGIEAAYYLVHSMGPGASRKTFSTLEQECAANFVAAAEAAEVSRLIYLSGLHPDGPLSPHLSSRMSVGELFLRSSVPTVVLQAGVVIGSGSASFEMIRHLTEVLPWMPAPRWVNNLVQPIAVRDVLYYLVHALDLAPLTNRTFDIGGPDVLSYAAVMNGYAAEAGLPKRLILALPVLTPRLAAHWVNLVTPIPHSLAGPLVESLQHSCVVREHDLDELLPEPLGGRTGYRQAVQLALGKMRNGQVLTSWQNSSVAGAPSDPLPSDPDWAGQKVYTDLRSRSSDASVTQLWRVIEGIGGARGWYSFPLAWALRGWMDKFVGGVGLRRGRRDPDALQVGEALDFWRVEGLERGHLLRLRAEMKVPGRAWLEMTVDPGDDGQGCRYQQRAVFFPRGLLGRLYWFSVLPFHGIIFNGMANRIIQAAGIDAR